MEAISNFYRFSSIPLQNIYLLGSWQKGKQYSGMITVVYQCLGTSAAELIDVELFGFSGPIICKFVASSASTAYTPSVFRIPFSMIVDEQPYFRISGVATIDSYVDIFVAKNS